MFALVMYVAVVMERVGQALQHGGRSGMIRSIALWLSYPRG